MRCGILRQHRMRAYDSGKSPCIIEIITFACSCIKFSRSPFHIVGPGILVVPVRRSIGIALLVALVFPPQGVQTLRGLQALRSEAGFSEFSVPPNPRRHGHGGRRTPRNVGHTRRLAFILPQPLRLSIGKVGSAVTVRSPSVI